jgi:fructose-bisphosphate aldolase class II
VLESVKEQTKDLPLVLHGGTGIPADMVKKAIDLGVAKINVNTECQIAFTAAVRKYIEEGKDLEGKGFDPRKVLKPGVEGIKSVVREKIQLFGSEGKA